MTEDVGPSHLVVVAEVEGQQEAAGTESEEWQERVAVWRALGGENHDLVVLEAGHNVVKVLQCVLKEKIGE